MIAKLVDTSLPQELISWFLFLNKGSKILMQLSSLMIVYKGLDCLTDSLLEGGMLEENELLRELGLASWDVVVRHVTYKKETEDILEEINIIVS